jgi:DNA gyrase subunit A
MPGADIDELMKHVPGPDFPTAALINGASGYLEAYRTGRGRVHIRAQGHFEESTATAAARRSSSPSCPTRSTRRGWSRRSPSWCARKKLEGISELRDESDKDGMRVVIELRAARTATSC